MASEWLPNVNNTNSDTTSLSDFLAQINTAYNQEKANVEEINKLKISNVKNLAHLQEEEEKKLIKKYTDAKNAAADKENQKALERSQALIKQMQDQQAAAEAAGDKAEAQRLKKKIKSEENRQKAEAKARSKTAEKEAKEEVKAAKKKEQSEKLKAAKDLAHQASLLNKETTAQEKFKALGDSFKRDVYDADGNKVGTRTGLDGVIGGMANMLSDMAKQLDSSIDKIASYKSKIDTRLQGLNRKTGGFFGGGSYWDNISKNITGMAGVSPFIRQSDLAEKVNQMVGQGIAFNVEQRAAMDVLKDKIATTFDAANGTLLRLVRIQQQDTTAARLGMESSLTAFLNNMYETTEYMSSIATSIKGSLEEAMSLMTGENALSFEYQIQKWLGSMYSVGMSDSAVQGLGGVLGKLAAGQLEGITQGGQGNLVIMAANQAGLSISDLLNNGLNANTTNQLLNSMVEYLAKLYQEAGDSKVIQQQIAQVYGMSAADLKAAVNLAKSTGVISRDGLTYGGAINQLYSMANSMYKRVSVGEMMTNVWDNFQYTMASGIANNPALYAMYKAAGLLDAVAGGIAIPAFSVYGNMVDLETTVADLMRAGAMGGSILSGIGTMLSAGGGGGITGSGILNALKVRNMATVSRGTGVGLSTAGGVSYSESGVMVGNSAGGDVQNKTMTDANDSGQAQLAEAVETTDETKLSEVYTEVVNIYRLLQDIADGHYTLNVAVDGDSLSSGL